MELGIYNAQMLRLAAEAAGAGRLSARASSAKVVNPVCGDQITVDVATAGGRIAAIGYEVHACVLTQASASLLGRHAPGRTATEIGELAIRIEEMLRSKGAAPDGDWSGYAALAPVQAHGSRHECVMLPLRALLAALAGGGSTGRQSQD
jgi:NifU-like protein involved in Fe-S cluster formation